MHTFRRIFSIQLRWYWGNAVVTSFADSLISFALILLVLKATGSLSLMALISIVIAIPNILFGLFSAVWVDRWNPVKVVKLSQLFRSVVVCMFMLADWYDAIWLLFVVAFVQSIVGTFDDPARGKLARALTSDEDRLSVNSFTQTGRTLASVVGTTAAGLLVAGNNNYAPIFMLAAMLYFVAGWLAGHISIPSVTPEPPNALHPEPTYWVEFRLGFKAIKESTTLMAVLIAASAATIGASAATVLLTPLIVDELAISPAWFGPIEASQAAGSILVSLAIGVVGSRIDPRRLTVIALITTGSAIGLIGLSTDLMTLMLFMLLVGVAISPVNSSISTLFQTHTDPAVIGRVAAILNTVVEPFSILGMAGAGLLADQIGIRPVFWIAGAVCATAGLIASTLFARDRKAGGTKV